MSEWLRHCCSSTPESEEYIREEAKQIGIDPTNKHKGLLCRIISFLDRREIAPELDCDQGALKNILEHLQTLADLEGLTAAIIWTYRLDGEPQQAVSTLRLGRVHTEGSSIEVTGSVVHFFEIISGAFPQRSQIVLSSDLEDEIQRGILYPNAEVMPLESSDLVFRRLYYSPKRLEDVQAHVAFSGDGWIALEGPVIEDERLFFNRGLKYQSYLQLPNELKMKLWQVAFPAWNANVNEILETERIIRI